MTSFIPNNQPGRIHIDGMTVNGPLEHHALGELFYKAVSDTRDEVIAVGASGQKQRGKAYTDKPYVRSNEVQPDGTALKLQIDCCPPKVLQMHNFFGHDDLLDYNYAVFNRVVNQFMLPVEPHEHEEWRTGQVSVTNVHLCGNFHVDTALKMPIFDAVDRNNSSGKHRPRVTNISLGWKANGSKSEYHTLSLYDKYLEQVKEWKNAGPLQQAILAKARTSIRVEVKLNSQWLRANDLQYVMRWKDIDVQAIFFAVLATYDVANAIQPLPEDSQLVLLSQAARRAYSLWLGGVDLSTAYGRTGVWKHRTEVLSVLGIDMRGQNRPVAKPVVQMRAVLTPNNIVPLPSWALDSPRYWVPGTAFLENDGQRQNAQ
ncbi:MAG: phage/plasmid replication protein, II/X family [Polaromonas sp.]|nr:phage/plasmid replication protein, II/X family [Polaromonas sp.]